MNYEDLDNSELDKLLARFYAGARSKQGTEYSAKTMHCVRFGLQRHFQSSKGIDIKGKDFPLSLRTFKATLTKLKAKGKASVKHYPPISDEDMKIIQESLGPFEAQGFAAESFCRLHDLFCEPWDGKFEGNATR